MREMDDGKKIEIPEVTVGSMVHSCGADGYCVATIVAAVLSNFDDEGGVIAHVAFPSPGMPTVCNNAAIKYHKPESKTDRPLRTWHLISECTGGCKKMDVGSRIIH